MENTICKMVPIINAVGIGSLDKLLKSNWCIMVLNILYWKKHAGFNQLEEVSGLNPKVLAETLEWLSANGFVKRTNDGSRIAYRIEKMGNSLISASCPIVYAKAAQGKTRRNEHS